MDESKVQTEKSPGESVLHPLWWETGLSLAGAFIGMGLICLVSLYSGLWLLIPSFGSSAIMLYTSPNTPMAQPRNVLGGHLMSALSGIIIHQFIVNNWWAVTLSVVLATFLMIITQTLHPPGGGTAIVALVDNPLTAIIIPVVVGSVILILATVLVNRLLFKRRYPKYWF